MRILWLKRSPNKFIIKAISSDDDPVCNAVGIESTKAVGLGPGLAVVLAGQGGHLIFLQGWSLYKTLMDKVHVISVSKSELSH
eukprot:m.130993 g.130993  ORF g.130993 m.130993 type:complete len:83 (-) comp14612_c0_seq17:313-561(-)